MSIRRLSDGRYLYRHEIRKLGSSRADLELMDRRIKSIVADHGRAGQRPDTTILMAAPQWLAHCNRNRCTTSTIRWYETAIKSAAEVIGDRLLGEVTMADVERLQDAWCKTSTGCANRRLRVLRRLARWAVRTGRWRADVSLVDWLSSPLLREAAPRRDTIEMDRVADLLERLPEHVRIPLELSALCCVRPSAVLLADWSDVVWPSDVSLGVVGYRTMKSGVSGDVSFESGDAIHGALLRARAAWVRIRGRAPRGGRVRDPLCVTSRGLRWTCANLDRLMHHHLAGTAYARATPYTIRRSVITYLWSTGADPAGLQAVAKHRRFSTTEGYIRDTQDSRHIRVLLGAAVRRAQ
jgi:integrase